jgi:hypothetical protein
MTERSCAGWLMHLCLIVEKYITTETEPGVVWLHLKYVFTLTEWTLLAIIYPVANVRLVVNKLLSGCLHGNSNFAP